MTVLEVIQRSTEFLAKRGVDSPRLQVELMLAHVLKLPRLQLYLNFERKLDEAQLTTLRAMVQRRGTREPLQHILGSVSFCGVEISVNRHVLIPRPETEQLAELAVQFLKAAGSSDASRLSVLDLCTGSGCLAVYLALKCPQAKVSATDVAGEAIETARGNAAAAKVDSISFSQGDLFSALPAGSRFDLIVSNPPYIPSEEIATLQPEVRDHDPRLALDGGGDGLAFYRRIVAESSVWLKPGGCLMLEFGDGQGPALMKLFASAEWRSQRLEKDLSGRERFFIASTSAA